MPEVSPIVHNMDSVNALVEDSNHNSERVMETIGGLAVQERWKELWSLADKIGKEVSILVDSEDRVWVDIGTRGRVALSPPIGSSIPFVLWVHTHPWDAYWSSTDLNTIASHSFILERAIVLGFDHLKMSRRLDSKPDRGLEEEGPLSKWTDEPLVYYSESQINDSEESTSSLERLLQLSKESNEMQISDIVEAVVGPDYDAELLELVKAAFEGNDGSLSLSQMNEGILAIKEWREKQA